MLWLWYFRHTAHTAPYLATFFCAVRGRHTALLPMECNAAGLNDDGRKDCTADELSFNLKQFPDPLTTSPRRLLLPCFSPCQLILPLVKYLYLGRQSGALLRPYQCTLINNQKWSHR